MRMLFSIPILLLLVLPGLWAADPPIAHAAATAAEWQAAPLTAAALAEHQAQVTASLAPVASSFWAEFGTITLAVGGILASLALRFAAPGGAIAGVGVPLLNLAWRCLAPDHVQEAERKQVLLAQGMSTAVHLIEILPKDGTIGELKSALADRMPAGTKDHINEIITDIERSQLAKGT